MNKSGFGLLLKFTLFLSLLIVITSLLLSVVNTGIEWFRIEADVKNKGYSLARNLAFNAEYGILADNRDELSRLVKGLMEEGSVTYAQVFNSEKMLLAQQKKTSRTDLEITVPVKSVKVARSPEEIGLSPLAELNTIDLTKTGEESVIGEVRIGINLSQTVSTIERLLFITSGLTLLVILIGIAGISFLTRYLLIKPLKQFVAGTQMIAEGNFSHRIELTSRDEIGDLAESFNQMTLQLEKAQKQLSDYARSLEDKVAARTHELELAKAGLEQKVIERTAELEKERASLEKKVEERTKELKTKVLELEQFYQVAVGRELKMIDVEKEINGLLKELGRAPKY